MTAEPDYAVAPGEYITEWMDDTGTDISQLSKSLNMTERDVNSLLSGDMPILPEIASQLEKAIGIPEKMWMKHERHYRAERRRIGDN